MNSMPHALVVEDLDFWQDGLHEILTDAGYRVWVASSYAEALAPVRADVHTARRRDDGYRHGRSLGYRGANEEPTRPVRQVDHMEERSAHVAGFRRDGGGPRLVRSSVPVVSTGWERRLLLTSSQ